MSVKIEANVIIMVNKISICLTSLDPWQSQHVVGTGKGKVEGEGEVLVMFSATWLLRISALEYFWSLRCSEIWLRAVWYISIKVYNVLPPFQVPNCCNLHAETNIEYLFIPSSIFRILWHRRNISENASPPPPPRLQ